MIQAVHIRTESKFFISSLNITVQMTQQQHCNFPLKSARRLSTLHKCQLRFNPNFEATSVRADSPYRILPKPSGSTGMEKPRHWVMLRD